MMNNTQFQNIISSQNNQIKNLVKLKLSKYRKELNEFTVENSVIINDALKDGFDFESLFVTEEFINKNEDKIDFFKKNSKADNFYLIDSKINNTYSSLDTPSGITAVYRIKERKLDDSSVVYLNGISDPGNLGTILRSALAFNFRNIVLDKNCVDIYSPKVIGAAKDTIFKLNIYIDKSGNWIKNCKMPIYSSSSHQGENLNNFEADHRFCLILGSESHGVDEEIIKNSNKILKIEISPEIESLNVATAAAILLYTLRQ